MKDTHLMVRKRKRKKANETPEDRFQTVTKDYEEAVAKNTWKVEKKLADELLNAAKELNLDMKIDRLTEYRLNSFPIAILQQLRRKDVIGKLDKKIQDVANEMDQRILRREIVNFIKSSDNPEVLKMKRDYKETSQDSKPPWKTWKGMLKDTWVEPWFIQATAWYLQLYIHVVRIVSDPDNPVILDKVLGKLIYSDEKTNNKEKCHQKIENWSIVYWCED